MKTEVPPVTSIAARSEVESSPGARRAAAPGQIHPLLARTARHDPRHGVGPVQFGKINRTGRRGSSAPSSIPKTAVSRVLIGRFLPKRIEITRRCSRRNAGVSRAHAKARGRFRWRPRSSRIAEILLNCSCAWLFGVSRRTRARCRASPALRFSFAFKLGQRRIVREVFRGPRLSTIRRSLLLVPARRFDQFDGDQRLHFGGTIGDPTAVNRQQHREEPDDQRNEIRGRQIERVSRRAPAWAEQSRCEVARTRVHGLPAKTDSESRHSPCYGVSGSNVDGVRTH